jgi:hypothetical protein
MKWPRWALRFRAWTKMNEALNLRDKYDDMAKSYREAASKANDEYLKQLRIYSSLETKDEIQPEVSEASSGVWSTASGD